MTNIRTRVWLTVPVALAVGLMIMAGVGIATGTTSTLTQVRDQVTISVPAAAHPTWLPEPGGLYVLRADDGTMVTVQTFPSAAQATDVAQTSADVGDQAYARGNVEVEVQPGTPPAVQAAIADHLAGYQVTR